MIMSMKIISLAFDISNCAIDYLPDIWQYLGYVFNVGTVIFGPWINFQEYCNITQQHLRPLVSIYKFYLNFCGDYSNSK